MTALRGDPQVGGALSALRNALGGSLSGVYLLGSGVTSGLRPASDIDLMAVAQRCTSTAEKRSLVDALLRVSGSPRPIELTVVVASEVKPWSYPPRMDFQYGEWWRDEYAAGRLEPWGSPVNPDLVTLIRMVLEAGVPLLGPAPAELFDPVPPDDYVRRRSRGSTVSSATWSGTRATSSSRSPEYG